VRPKKVWLVSSRIAFVFVDWRDCFGLLGDKHPDRPDMQLLETRSPPIIARTTGSITLLSDSFIHEVKSSNCRSLMEAARLFWKLEQSRHDTTRSPSMHVITYLEAPLSIRRARIGKLWERFYDYYYYALKREFHARAHCVHGST